jgi:hypothetical protein
MSTTAARVVFPVATSTLPLVAVIAATASVSAA